MTYPPQPGQPGQPGQPDPYGQYGGQPQSGGFPQQGGYPQGGYPQQGQYGQPQGGYPQGDQYGQQQGGYPQGEAYSQGGGFGGPPPAKGKTGLWIGLGVGGVALLAIGALLFTGFVAPGFFLSDPKAVVDDLAKAITDKDAESAKALICKLQSDDDALTDEDIEKFKTANISMKVLGDAKEISDTEAHVPAEITFEGLTQTGEFVVKDENGWCVSTFKNSSGTGGGGAPVPSTANSVDPPSTGSSGASGAATSLAQQFIDKVNSGDKSGATSLVCDSSKDLVGSSLDRAISDGISAKMKSTPSDSSSFVIIELEGERDGRSASGNMSMSSNDSGATWCVLTFHMF